jgi:hypothetical protein
MKRFSPSDKTSTLGVTTIPLTRREGAVRNPDGSCQIFV